MRELATDEIDALLTRNGIGTLALVDGTVPYAIPMSFGYCNSDRSITMHWGTGYGGRKEQLIQKSAKACFTVYERYSHDPQSWRSVVSIGEIYTVPKTSMGQALARLANNAEFAPDFGTWDLPLEEIDLVLLEMRIDEITGREYSILPGA